MFPTKLVTLPPSPGNRHVDRIVNAFISLQLQVFHSFSSKPKCAHLCCQLLFLSHEAMFVAAVARLIKS